MSEFTGKKLKEAHVKKGLSQDEAANLMNVAKRAISEMEAGKRSITSVSTACTGNNTTLRINLKTVPIPYNTSV